MTSSFRPSTILLIEDNEDTRFIVSELVYDAGLTSCDEVESYQALVDFLSTYPDYQPAIVLVDLQLPDADGYQVLDFLRNHTYLGQMQIIAFTAHVFESDLRRIREAGFDGFIGKPIEEHAFIQTIQRLLDGENVWLYQSKDITTEQEVSMQNRVSARLQPQRETYIATVQQRVPWMMQVWASVVNEDTTFAALATLHQNVHYLAGSAATLGFAQFSATLHSLDLLLRQILDDHSLLQQHQENIEQLLTQLSKMIDQLPNMPISWTD